MERISKLTKDLERRKSLLGVDVEHLLDKILGSRRDFGPRIAGEVNLPTQDGGEDAILILCQDSFQQVSYLNNLLVSENACMRTILRHRTCPEGHAGKEDTRLQLGYANTDTSIR
jgi:hypothetical protein